MSASLAFNQPDFEFEAGSFAAGDLWVLEMRGEEEISRPYRLDLVLLSAESPASDPAELVGEEATLTVLDGQGAVRYFHGIVARVSSWETGGNSHRHRYSVRIVPRLWRLSQTRRSRAFQHMTTPGIVKAVLADAGVEVRDALSVVYPPRDYSVQYRESDLDFVSRLLEEEGIFYFFEHAKSAHTMVLADALSAFEWLPGAPQIPFHQELRSPDETDRIDAFTVRRELLPSKVFLRDFDPRSPRADLSVASGTGLEVYQYPGRFDDLIHGKDLCAVQVEGLRGKAEGVAGAGTCRKLCPGWAFELTNHPMNELNEEYVILRVKHQGWQPEVLGALASGSGDAPPGKRDYQNTFDCAKRANPFRPERRTPWPRVEGPQTAIVVGPKSEEIFTDEQGRIQVKFHWVQEGSDDARSSCWIRVSQAWAGVGWGSLFLPRVGQEVVVEFLDGDPDRPLVVGSVYNGEQATPLDLPTDKTRSTVRSSSSPGGDGSNELRFEDADGSEEVYLHAQRDLNVHVGRDAEWQVGGDETLTVDADRMREVHGNQVLAVNEDDDTTVAGDQTICVGGNRRTTVEGDQTEEISANQDVIVEGSFSRVVNGKSIEKVSGWKAVGVGAALQLGVAGDMKETVKGRKSERVGLAITEVVRGEKSETIEGDRSVHVVAEDSETVKKDWSAKIGKDYVVNVAGKLSQIAAKEHKLEAQELTLSAKDRIVIKVGQASLEIKKGGDIVLKGKKVQVSAKQSLTLKGSKITDN
jgi:type VI secretion system secreted protein VgrG